MKLIKSKFYSLNVGREFVWSSNNFKKIGKNRAVLIKNRQEFIFKNNDTILIEEEEIEEELDMYDFENTYNGIIDDD